MLPEVLGPTGAGRRVGRASVVGPGHRRQHGRRARARAAPRRRRAQPRHAAAPRSRVSDEPTADPTGTVAGFADATGRFLPLVCTLNATKVTDAVARLLGVDAAELDALALAGAARRRRSGARPAPRRRAHAEPPGRDRGAHRHPLRRRPASSSPGPRSRASSATCSPAPIDLAGRPATGGSCSSAAAPAAPPTARSSPTSPAGPCSSPTPSELVARGAAVQAAAVAHRPLVRRHRRGLGPRHAASSSSPTRPSTASPIRAAYSTTPHGECPP